MRRESSIPLLPRHGGDLCMTVHDNIRPEAAPDGERLNVNEQRKI